MSYKVKCDCCKKTIRTTQLMSESVKGGTCEDCKKENIKQFHTTFDVAIDLGKAIPEVGSLCSEINTHMSDMGHEEKMCVLSNIGNVTISGNRQPTKEEIEIMRQTLQKELENKFQNVVFVKLSSNQSCNKSSSSVS